MFLVCVVWLTPFCWLSVANSFLLSTSSSQLLVSSVSCLHSLVSDLSLSLASSFLLAMFVSQVQVGTK